MNTLTRYLFLLTPLCISPSIVHTAEIHWTYKGNHGPSHWGEFSSGLCSAGSRQSPINVDRQHIQPLKGSTPDLRINYEATALNLKNNGHTIQIDVINGGSVRFKGNSYALLQFHFHTPSEHLINQMPYPMEMHLVNQDKDGRLLVLGIMIKEGDENEVFTALWSRLPTAEGKKETLDANAAPNLNTLIPRTSHHLFYEGSLTTPPCTEGVQWVLFEQPIELSRSQIDEFRRIFSDNHRPVQPVNERAVEED
ncbi:carbonic anhydrase [Pseudomonas aeruginosa]